MQTDEKLFGILAELRDEYTKRAGDGWVRPAELCGTLRHTPGAS